MSRKRSKTSSDTASSVSLVNEAPTITPKEARKLLGTDIAKSLEDTHLTRIVRAMRHLAEALLGQFCVPQNGKVVVE